MPSTFNSLIVAEPCHRTRDAVSDGTLTQRTDERGSYQALATVMETRRGMPDRRPDRPLDRAAIMPTGGTKQVIGGMTVRSLDRSGGEEA